ncbi:hypothetical protein D3C85_1743710 [compost metagenome]
MTDLSCRLVFALVDLVEQVVELGNVVFQIRRHEQDVTCGPVAFDHEMLVIRAAFRLAFPSSYFLRWNG